jgi:signal transduction histidine kinase
MTAPGSPSTLEIMREPPASLVHDTGLPDRVVDGIVAAGLTAFILVGTYFASHGQPLRRGFDVGAALLILVVGGGLFLRRTHPVAALATVFAAVLVYWAAGYAGGPIWLGLVVSFVGAVMRGHRLAAGTIAILGFGLIPWMDTIFRNRPGPAAVSLAGLAAWLLVLFGVGEAVRVRRERAAEAAQMREEETLRRASEERLRIARELHDALGHHLSLINVQAGVALHVHEALPTQVSGSLSAIKEASKEALTELRSVLEILRQDGERAPRAPTSTLERLTDLVAQASAAGLEVRTEVEGNVRALPFGVDVAAFRIVQEALTNVARHSASTTALVRVAYGDRDLRVSIDDDGPDVAAPPESGGGRGLLGMRERVAALGGDLEAGPRPGGGFRVLARLPLADAA